MIEEVYIIQHEGGPVKIGRSHDPEKRLEKLQIGNPEELTLKTSLRTLKASVTERRLHDEFEEFHVHGEWFGVPENILLDTIQHLVSDDDNYVLGVDHPDTGVKNEGGSRKRRRSLSLDEEVYDKIQAAEVNFSALANQWTRTYLETGENPVEETRRQRLLEELEESRVAFEEAAADAMEALDRRAAILDELRGDDDE